jgi:hypothetical protein
LPHVNRVRAEPFRVFLHNKNMSSDDPETSALPAATDDVLAPVETTAPSLAEPEMLVKGLRYLQERIPDFTQLSVQEKRSHARAANLDPEFVEMGLHAAVVWRDTKKFVKRTGDDLRDEQDEIRRWDEVIRELRAVTDGVEAANVKRKHRLGKAILLIYRMLAIYVDRGGPEDAYMRPYFENMKRAYLQTQQFRRSKKKDKPAEEPPKA